MKKYCISFFNNCTDVIAKQEELSFEEILSYFNKVFTKPFTTKQNLGAMVCGSFTDNKRSAENLISRSILTFDLDGYEEDFNSLKNEIETSLGNYTYIYYTTSSSSLIKPRARILLFIDRDVDKNNYGKLGSELAFKLFSHKLLKAVTDESSFTPSQLMYLPNKVNDEFRRGKNVKELIKVDDYITVKEEIKKEDDEAKELIVWSNNLPLPNVTREIVIETLGKYDCKETDYKEWLRVAQALHHQFKGTEEGLEIFTNWSLTDTRYTREHIIAVCRDKYKSVKGGGLKPVTFASIIKLANVKKNLPVRIHKNSSLLLEINEDLFIDYRSRFTAKGREIKTIKNTYENFEIMCHQYKIKISYDIITKRNLSTMFEFEDDNLLTTEVESLMIRNNLDSGRAAKYVHMIAQKNKINSFKNVLDAVIWDGQSRFDEFAETVIVNPIYDSIKKLYLKKWMQQLIYLSHADKEDRKIGRYILVFQGEQEMGKSTWVRSLLPVRLKNYISEGLSLNVNDSMSVLSCIRHLIVELGELERSFKKTDINDFKAFFGRTKDELNIKYLPFPVSYPRTTSFIGSINDEEFLKDRTGSTRFLIIPTKRLNGYHDIDMLQLFKEIRETTDYINFELSDDEKVLQKEHNKMFEVPDILEEVFLDHYDLNADKEVCDYYSAMQVLEQLGYRKQDINNARRMDIGRIMRKYKCHRNTKTKKWLLKIKEKDQNVFTQ